MTDPERFRMPDLLHPGHISEQQDKMRVFDPFTRSDIGPRIEGDRPHGSGKATPVPKQLWEGEQRRMMLGY